MDMPAGTAASLDRLAAIVGSRVSAACGVLDADGRSWDHAPRPSDVAVFPEATQDVHPSPDLRA